MERWWTNEKGGKRDEETTEAIIKLVEELGGEVVKVLFLMELEGLKGRDKIAGYDVESVIKYPGK